MAKTPRKSPRKTKNPEIAHGIRKYGHSRVHKIRVLHKRIPKTPKTAAAAAPKKEKAPTTKTKTIGGKNNGSTRVVPLKKAPRVFPAEKPRRPIPRRRVRHPGKLRSSITPGTVLILVASGRFRGKRVVFLKRLPSGLLLVTGPFRINGVPLRRVNQAYVIATSTKVDISGVNLDKFDDKYFKPARDAKKKSGQEKFLKDDKAAKKDDKAAKKDDKAAKKGDKKDTAEKKKKSSLPASRVTDQKEVDKKVLAVVKKTPLLASYLKHTFSLSSGQYPHNMKF